MCKNNSQKHYANSELSHLEIKLALSKVLDRLDTLEEKIDDLHNDLLDHILDESFEYGHEDHEDEDEDECESCEYEGECHCSKCGCE